MILNELYEPSKPGYQDQEDDESRITLDDLRKTKLTLRQLNKLRRLIDVRNFEMKENLKKVKTQYAPPPQPMSSTLHSGCHCKHDIPHCANDACPVFIPQSIILPKKPSGFRKFCKILLTKPLLFICLRI